jgi:hypothetical protein
MKPTHAFFTFSIMLLLSCSSSKITVLEDNEGQFKLSDFATFNFLGVEAEGELQDDYKQRIELIKDEIISKMESRGMAYEPDQAELGINIGILVEEKTQTRETSLMTDPGTFNYIGQRRYSWKSETIELGKYKLGTATIHFIDTKANKAVWVGVIEKILSENPEKTNEVIRKSVADLFEKLD